MAAKATHKSPTHVLERLVHRVSGKAVLHETSEALGVVSSGIAIAVAAGLAPDAGSPPHDVYITVVQRDQKSDFLRPRRTVSASELRPIYEKSWAPGADIAGSDLLTESHKSTILDFALDVTDPNALTASQKSKLLELAARITDVSKDLEHKQAGRTDAEPSLQTEEAESPTPERSQPEDLPT
jgi:hypothetical protein